MFRDSSHTSQAWIGEGEWFSFLFTNGQFTAPLDPALKEKGITEENWADICRLLRKGKGRIVVDARNPKTGKRSLFGFSKVRRADSRSAATHTRLFRCVLTLGRMAAAALANLSVCHQAIKLVNETYLERLGCIGVYSEYRNGMKAMAVYTKAVWDAKPDKKWSW